MLLGTLGAILLGDILAGKEIVRAGYGSKGEGTIRVGYGSERSSSKKNFANFEIQKYYQKES